jgi:hypothetical protein
MNTTAFAKATAVRRSVRAKAEDHDEHEEHILDSSCLRIFRLRRCYGGLAEALAEAVVVIVFRRWRSNIEE